MGKKLYNKNIAAKHESCIWFDELCAHLEDSYPGFGFGRLADDLDCTTNRIRDIRKGKSVLEITDIDVLRKKYGVNLLFLTDHSPPYQLSGELSIVSEPSSRYGRSAEEEIAELKKTNALQEEIIALLREKYEPKREKKTGTNSR